MIIELNNGDLDTLMRTATHENIKIFYKRLCDHGCFDDFCDLVRDLQGDGAIGHDVLGDMRVGGISVTDEEPYTGFIAYKLNDLWVVLG